MPELPEVETMARTLADRVAGREIESFRLLYPPLLKNGNKSELEGIIGKRIDEVWRRGKIVVFVFDGGDRLLFHPKMTGLFLFCPRQKRPDKHTHFSLALKDLSDELCFKDVRKFGFMCYEDHSRGTGISVLDGLGPEPFDLNFTRFKALFSSRCARLKSLLVNQGFIAGIGNIYADEILFQAGIHPFRTAETLSETDLLRLWKAMQDVLKEAIKKRGTSIRSYVDAEGRKGEYQLFFKVYGRAFLPCLRCGSCIERIRCGGRSTHFCPVCQR